MQLSLIFKNILKVLLLLALMLLTACFHDKNNAPELTEVGKGTTSSNSNSQLFEVYDTQAEFEAAYALTELSISPAPILDFSINTVIGLFMGEQVTSGFAIKATSIKIDGSTLIVFIEKTIPGDNCVTAQVITQPFQFIRVPGIYSMLKYELKETVYDCDSKTNNPTAEIEFSEIRVGGLSPYTTSLLKIYDNQEAFNATYAFRLSESEEIPLIDFDKNNVLGLFMGERPSTGHNVQVLKITEYDNHLLVDITLNESGLVCPAGAAVTQPYQFVKFAKTSKWILFNEKVLIDDCNPVITAGENQTIDFSVIREGGQSQYTQNRVLEVFSNQESFETAYYLSGSEINPPAAPLIDFTEKQLVGLFLQTLNVSGQQYIRVKSVEKNNLFTTVHIELTKLKSECPADAALSNPYQFVSIENTGLPVVFSESLVEQSCE